MALLRIAVVLATAGLVAAPTAGTEAIRFENRTLAWGVSFRHHHGGSGERYLVETMVGGVVLFDYDGDGDPDLFFVDGGTLPGYEGEPARSVLLRNDGGRFVDMTTAAGLTLDGYGCGGTAGDIDADGDVDLYVSVFGENRLFRNEGDGRFTDVTSSAGVGERLWSASAAFADTDRDGDLDLYVANYVDAGLSNHKRCLVPGTEVVSYCHPDAYEPQPDRFFRNEGDGRFVDWTRESGFAGAIGPGLGVVFADFSNDGWPDLYVANDLKPNYFFSNRKDGTFEDQSLLSGTAFGDRAQPEAGMGVDADDVDGDGDLDLVVSNFEYESNGLYLNAGSGLFVDARYRSRLADPSIPRLGFGLDFADFDHDGDVDLVVGNGHVHDNAHLVSERSSFEQPNQVFENRGDGVFDVVDAGLDTVRATRGLATGDLDLDGDLDLVLVNSNDLAEAWENVGAGRGWLQVDLVADRSAPLGVGARVTVTTGERVQIREGRTASSYLSQNAATIHFGLASPPVVDRLEVAWPSGERQVFRRLPSSFRYRLSE